MTLLRLGFFYFSQDVIIEVGSDMVFFTRIWSKFPQLISTQVISNSIYEKERKGKERKGNGMEWNGMERMLDLREGEDLSESRVSLRDKGRRVRGKKKSCNPPRR